MVKHCVLLLLLFSCSGRETHTASHQTSTEGVTFKEPIERGFGVYRDSTGIQHSGVTLYAISLFLKDSVSSNETHMFNPIPLNQMLFFRTKDSVTHTVQIPSNLTYQEDEAGIKIPMLDNEITTVGWVESPKGTLFLVEGYGGCNSCKEYQALFNQHAQMLYCTYGDKRHTDFSRGDFTNVVHQYGLTDSAFYSNLHQKEINE